MSNFNAQRLLNVSPQDFTNDNVKKCLEDMERDHGKEFVDSFTTNSMSAALNLLKQLNSGVDKKEFIIRSFNSFNQIHIERFKILLQSRDFNQLSDMAKSNKLHDLTSQKLSDFLTIFNEEKVDSLFVIICTITI
jgi:hypothetical protein